MDHGFLDRRTVPSPGVEHIYSLTTHSAARLEEIEERFSLSLSTAEQGRRPERDPFGRTQQHPTASGRAGILAEWISETEIRAENELAGLCYKKEYDVVTLRCSGRDLTSRSAHWRATELWVSVARAQLCRATPFVGLA
jgi:hypothetical protein